VFHLKKSHQKTEAAPPAAYTRKKNTKKATGKSASSEPHHRDLPNSTTKNRKTAPAERNSQAAGMPTEPTQAPKNLQNHSSSHPKDLTKVI